MPTPINLSTANISTVIRKSDGALMVMTTDGLVEASQAGVTFTGGGSGGGGTGGSVTIADGADATTGTKADPIVADLSNATLMSAVKTQADALLSVKGSKAPGTAAASSLAVGGVYNSGVPNYANGQQGALMVDVAGNLNSRLRGTAGIGADSHPNSMAYISGHSDGGGGGARLLGIGNMAFNGTAWDRLRGNSKGLFTIPGAPETLAGSSLAQSVTGTSMATASAVATISNPELLYKKVGIYLTNNSGTALTDLVIRTKQIIARSYDITYAAEDDYDQPAGPLLQVSVNPLSLGSGQTTYIILDISTYRSIQLAASVAAGSTTVDVEYEMIAVVGI
jgi:hypothetical protein